MKLFKIVDPEHGREKLEIYIIATSIQDALKGHSNAKSCELVDNCEISMAVLEEFRAK